MNRKTHLCVFNMLMAFSSCLQLEPFFKVDSYSYSSRVMLRIIPRYNVMMKQQLPSTLGFKQVKGRSHIPRKGSAIRASVVSSSQIAGSAFTWGTVAVLPFYTLMIVAPKAKLTKKCMESSMPYMVLGLVYAYLLHLSWSPNTIQAMFATKYLLPELPGIAKLFSNEMSLASAWIHLLAIDLFAARQIFDDGRQNGIETRHSISLCLLSCPLGILSHFITKALTKSSAHNEHDDDM